MPVTRDTPLTGVLADLAAAAGEDAALALAEAFGGRSLYVPARIRSYHPIARAIGFEAARALSELRGPGRVDVPLGPAARNSFAPEIRRRLASGMSADKIAREVGCTRRTVFRVKASLNHAQGP